MNPTNTTLLVVALLFATLSTSSRGQTVIGAPATATGSPFPSGFVGGYSTFGSTVPAPLSSLASALASPIPLFQAGPLAIRPHLSYEVVRGSGILRTPGAPEKFTTNTVSAGISLEAGSRITADYTLSRVMYSSTLSDATNHNLTLQGGITYDKSRLGVSGTYGSNSTVLVETGGQTKRDLYSTNAVVAYQLGMRSELELNLSHSVESANPVEGTATWTDADWTLWGASTWFRYHVSKSLSAALGVSGGYDDIKTSSDMSHTQPQVQVIWQPTQKVFFSAEAGIERRKTRATQARVQENGRYSVSARYNPFSTTTLSISAGRSVDPSYFSGQTTQSDSWSVALQQRLITKLFLSVSASRRDANYESALVGLLADRDDEYNSFDVRLSTPILSKGSVAVFYNRIRNRSNEALYDFKSNQIGVNLSYRF